MLKTCCVYFTLFFYPSSKLLSLRCV